MKYLVSLYFDNETTQQIMQYIKAVFVATGNDYMIKHKVPPHITISSFETENIEAVLPKISLFNGCRIQRLEREWMHSNF